MSAPTQPKTSLRKKLRGLGSALLYLGIDPRGLGHLRHIPKYLSQYRAFKRLGGQISHRFPVLADYSEQAGAGKGQYFHQDLLVASFVHQRNPVRHVDVGSRIDGFVAHVASFRRIEVMDVRALDPVGHENIAFIQANLMDPTTAPSGTADSISCLHAIEHFGLGRYGDPLDPHGHLKGFENIVRMLKLGGTLYISFPIAATNQVHFNAHRAFAPRDVLTWLPDPGCLELTRFDYVDDAGALHQNVDLLNQAVNVTYGCGIYTFKRLH
jgi:Caenorhabditis protein of unknown function, DUF268